MRATSSSIHVAWFAVLGLALLALSCGDEQSGLRPTAEREAKTAAKPAPPAERPAASPGAPTPEVEPTPPPPPAVPPPDAAPAAGQLVAENGVSLANLVVARDVDKRQPVDPGTSFAAPEPIRLYAIFDVTNPERAEGQLSVSWLTPDGKERGRVALSYPDQPRWRTWAFHSHVGQPGRWEAIVRTEDGQELGRAPFDVTP